MADGEEAGAGRAEALRQGAARYDYEQAGQYLAAGDHDRAIPHLVRALREAGDPGECGDVLMLHGASLAARERYLDAMTRYQNAALYFRRVPNERKEAVALTTGATVGLKAEQYGTVVTMTRRAIRLGRALYEPETFLTAVLAQAEGHLALGALDEAEGVLGEALGQFTTAQNPAHRAAVMDLMGRIQTKRPDNAASATRCFSIADRIRSTMLKTAIVAVAALPYLSYALDCAGDVTCS